MNNNLVKYLYIDDDENINVYVVGDIHGCYTQLMSKLKEIKFNFNTDLLICVGDLVDRGKENEKVFNLLREHWFISIKGNHEHFCQEGFLNDHVAYSHKAPNNGGSWFYKLNEDIQQTMKLISDVEMSSREQLLGIEQINDVINSLDQQTQENVNIANITHAIAQNTLEITQTIVKNTNTKKFDEECN